MSDKTSDKKDLLIELGTEELPPKALKGLAQAFQSGVAKGFADADLNYKAIKLYATPRRLALLVTQLAVTQPDKSIERRGPALQAAFDDEGCPTKAAQGFAKSCHVEVEQLTKLETDKGAWLAYTLEEKGRQSAELIPAIFQAALDKLPIPKRMHWGDLDALFVRPVHWAVILFGEEVIQTSILSVRTSNTTRGHRFHAPEKMTLVKPAEYEALLKEKGRVIADFDKRQSLIREQIIAAAEKAGGHAVIDPDLLDEVTSMIEWPSVIVGEFEKHFLDVPSEALISAMKKHQKYFHLVDDKQQLMPYFITISNVDSSDPEQIKKGNERVIRPRLSDANFFWSQDKKNPLEAKLERLKSVVFQNKLGTVYDKTLRVTELAGIIANELNTESVLAQRAARLAKCDLMSEMVNEFPDLQGIMGRYYALNDGEDNAVAVALDEQYMPRFSGDQTPASATGQVLAIAERIDTLMGIFALGQIPGGDKDPFALRRAALGLLRTIIENKLVLNIPGILKKSAALFPSEVNADKACDGVYKFMLERLKSYFTDQDISIDVFDAVTALTPAEPYDLACRIDAVNQFKQLDAAESLAAANKRIANILKKLKGDIPTEINSDLFAEEAEKHLAEQLSSVSTRVKPLLAQSLYTDALTELSELRDVVDHFFDDVMVMADDEALKNNRIALLGRLQGQFMQVADLSLLQ
ncbi:MAG: glycine--tRNA ligase subunit beta [gamma proteobacterium symbiont of Bathyaustriella thionipta]|nr:glycine--tRNA ligase subunit beta [gamma proteobacterium symbiont of Bathyaustriella thionipta]MCU7950130.1 glycine--tRNA ligase subunit beta [gamma proteobacterium symbiont of Bathyaustriella thionipta]MCU7954862.1 glycine--tRNA ligase subunit beta [gamma proteobacterium symbiont of Bathyaustriella thionipta]MCU7956691.1 glycine--tRNA ligase subunit beta [gamma proteobacterium symbiont of Bathyaustriella thionipta]MCU7968086.1 glycine--tRNA ligase subunit beta [gamma proteobacterium symbion